MNLISPKRQHQSKSCTFHMLGADELAKGEVAKAQKRFANLKSFGLSLLYSLIIQIPASLTMPTVYTTITMPSLWCGLERLGMWLLRVEAFGTLQDGLRWKGVALTLPTLLLTFSSMRIRQQLQSQLEPKVGFPAWIVQLCHPDAKWQWQSFVQLRLERKSKWSPQVSTWTCPDSLSLCTANQWFPVSCTIFRYFSAVKRPDKQPPPQQAKEFQQSQSTATRNACASHQRPCACSQWFRRQTWCGLAVWRAIWLHKEHTTVLAKSSKVALALARQHVFLANTSAITGKVVASMIFGCVFMFQFQLANALEPASLLPVRYA